MNIDTTIKLGQSTSLLNGYDTNICSSAYKQSPKPALKDTPITLKSPNVAAEWSSWPTITFHVNNEDLLSAIRQIRLRTISFEDAPSEGGAPARWPAGSLTLAGLTGDAKQTALRDLSDQIGLDISRDGWSYALVRNTRRVGSATHECFERGIFRNTDPENNVMPDALSALKALEKRSKTSTDVSVDGANGYLEFFKTFGSHFVTSVDVGDSLFQVFAFDEAQYKQVREQYSDNPEQLTGPESIAFAIFTNPLNHNGYGYTAAIGNICIMSQDPELKSSLETDTWLDRKYAGTNSIFTPLLRSDSINMNKAFTKLTVISTELASLEVFAEYYRKLIWRRVFKGAMYVNFVDGYGVAPYFCNNCPYDLNGMFTQSNPLGGADLLSTLATPSVNIWQELIDPNLITLQFPEQVVEFSLFANAIVIASPSPTSSANIDLPGSATVSLIGHVISVGGTGAVPPNLCLSESAYKTIKDRVYCGEFYGGLQVSSTRSSGECFVCMNGLIFEKVNCEVSVLRDIRNSPSMHVLDERFIDFQFALVAAEARLNFLLSTPYKSESGKELMKRLLLWLAGSNPYKEDRLAILQARAMYLASVTAGKHGNGIPVPYLKYKAYKDVIDAVQDVLQTASLEQETFQKQIRERQAEERNVERQTDLNDNIIRSGKLLKDYISTQANFQQSLQNMYSTTVMEKEKNLDRASGRASDLSVSLSKQRKLVDDTVVRYQDAVADWQKEETLKTAIDIVSNVFALGFAVVIPSGALTALTILGKTVLKIQKVVKVFDAVIKAYRSFKSIPHDPQNVVDALGDIGLNGLEQPSALEWDEMKVHMNAVLDTGPAVSAKNDLSAAFAVLVLRGKALLECQNEMQKIATDLSAAQQYSVLHKEQEKRLNNLDIDLDVKPEKLVNANIDLIGLSGQLIFFQRQMLMLMVESIVTQSRALQYEYLIRPVNIGPFTLLNLQMAILTQSQQINRGLSVQPHPQVQKNPVIYEIHGVKPGDLTNNQRFKFSIDLNKREFAPYNYVRVDNIDVQIGGITSSKSGKYYTELYYDGNPFYDRDFSGKTLTFQTTPRIYTSIHDVLSSSRTYSLEQYDKNKCSGFSATTSQDVFDDNVSTITPFSTWQVSLPNTESNKDIMFDNNPRGITVRLIFNILAQVKEGSLSTDQQYIRSATLRLREPFVPIPAISETKSVNPSTAYEAHSREDLVQAHGRPSFPTSLRTTTTASLSAEKVSVQSVLNMMADKSVCAGWDAVLSVTVCQVNHQLDSQFIDRKGNPKFLRSTGPVVHNSTTTDAVKMKTEFNFDFNAPKLQFLLNNPQSAQIVLPIISGTYRYSLFVNDSWMLIGHTDIKESDGGYIQGDVPFSVLQGSVSSQHHIAVSLNGGHFSAMNFEASVSNPMMGAILTTYFTSLTDGYEVYKFGTLDFKKIAVLPSLTPTNFLFNTFYTSSDRDLLQVFISTTGGLQANTYMTLQEPIPSNHDCSLIINSRIFFRDVLPSSLGDGGIGLVLDPVEPPDDGNKGKNWSSKAGAGSVSVPFHDTLVSKQYVPPAGSGRFISPGYYIRNYVKVPSDMVVIDLSGMIFKPGKTGSVENALVKTSEFVFQYGSVDIPSAEISYNKHVYPLKVTTKIKAHLPLTIDGSGMDQRISLTLESDAVHLDGDIAQPAGLCQCNDRVLQLKYLTKLRDVMTPKLLDLYNKPFQSISIFALKNILFPASNFIDMKKAFIPGDVVIFGNFQEP